MASFSILIAVLFVMVNLILIFRVIYTYAKIWIETHTSLQTQKENTDYEVLANKIFDSQIPHQELTVSVALKFNSRNSATSYEEQHKVTAGNNGAFSFQLGEGKITKGSYNKLAWGGHPAFMKISVNENHRNTLHGNYVSAIAV